MSIEVILQLLMWFIDKHGEKLSVIYNDTLKPRWQKTFSAHPLVILGPRGSGKSSLRVFLEENRPYEVVDGERRSPEPTLGVAIVNTKFQADKDSWLKIKKDVPGDEQLRDSWYQLIKEVRPHGIIYMLDGRELYKENIIPAAIEEHTQTVFTDVLNRFEDADSLLRVLYIFVNFSDLWSTGKDAENQVVRQILDELEVRLKTSGIGKKLRYDVRCVQLCPSKEKWEEVERALDHFGVEFRDR